LHKDVFAGRPMNIQMPTSEITTPAVRIQKRIGGGPVGGGSGGGGGGGFGRRPGAGGAGGPRRGAAGGRGAGGKISHLSLGWGRF
jgi:hypothetical protein